MSDFYKYVGHLLDIEGGYVNDPNDSGGETNFGITIRVARKFGYRDKMAAMTKETALKIYKAMYWDSLSLDEVARVEASIARELFDTGVNMGIGRAGEFIQRSLNALNRNGRDYPDLIVDMDVGPRTIQALIAYINRRGRTGVSVLLRCLNCLQGAFYIELAERRQKDESFLYGWILNRVD